MPSWLSRLRKQELVNLAREAGLKHDEDARRDDLIDALDAHLSHNATRLAGNPTFDAYYGSTARRTPGRPRASGSAGQTLSGEDAEVKSVVRGRGRRATQVKQEPIDDEEYGAVVSPSNQLASSSTTATSLARRTPGRPRRRSTLPPSPADITDGIEFAETRMLAGINDFVSVSGIPETINYVRETCSSVTGVQLTFLSLELLGLQRKLLPWTYTGVDLPSLPIVGLPSLAIYLPDLFKLVEGTFWSTMLLWSATSLIIPGFFAYFYNLTFHTVKRQGAQVAVAKYTVDPLTFNIVRALVTYLVYFNGVTFGVLNLRTRFKVESAMYGGYQGILVDCGVCILVSLYAAAQRR